MPARIYLLAVTAGVFLALCLYYLSLGMLQFTGNLPPPALSNSLCIDEKLRYMRDHPVSSPDLLIVGSSIAWRTFDAQALVDARLSSRPYNGGFCGLHTNQMAYVTNWLLDRHPGASHVLLVTAPQDFAECRINRTAVLDREDANRYLDGKAWQWPFYLEYFSPVSLVRNARKINVGRTNVANFDLLIFDDFGAGPLATTQSRPTLYYGAPAPLEQECFDALVTLGKRLQQDGRQFTVIVTPIHPDWKAQQDPAGRFMQEFRSRLRAAAAGVGAAYWDGDQEWVPERAAFTDAIHLRWSGAKEFSRVAAARLQGGVRPLTQDGRAVMHK